MYYNKNKVDHELENGINDAADIVENLYEFINNLVQALEDKDKITIKKLITDWEDI